MSRAFYSPTLRRGAALLLATSLLAACDESGLDDGPILAVLVEVPDVSRALGPHEPGGPELSQQLGSHPRDHLHGGGGDLVAGAETALVSVHASALPALERIRG